MPADRQAIIAQFRTMTAANLALLAGSPAVRGAAELTGGPYEARGGMPAPGSDTNLPGPRRRRPVSRGRPAPAAVTANTAREAEADQARRERRRFMEEWQAQHGDVVMLSRDDDAFASLYAAVESGEAVEYEHENVLAGSQNTFGIEIEFEGADLAAVSRALAEEGLSARSAGVGGYHGRRFSGKWTVERDSSVTSSNRGGEVVSPVLKDCRETWEQLEKVCEIIRRCGGQVTSKCGNHVHICADPLDARSFRWSRLMRIWAGFEDVFYRMASGGESRGVYRGGTFAKPLAMIVPSTFFADRETDQTEIRRYLRSRYYGLNFQNANPGDAKNTVEFRLFNGSLEPKQIQANVKLAMGAVHAADICRRSTETTRERNELIPRAPMPFGHTARSGEDPEDHGEVKKLLDILFVRSQDKAAALWLYASSKWQR